MGGCKYTAADFLTGDDLNASARYLCSMGYNIGYRIKCLCCVAYKMQLSEIKIKTFCREESSNCYREEERADAQRSITKEDRGNGSGFL